MILVRIRTISALVLVKILTSLCLVLVSDPDHLGPGPDHAGPGPGQDADHRGLVLVTILTTSVLVLARILTISVVVLTRILTISVLVLDPAYVGRSWAWSGSRPPRPGTGHDLDHLDPGPGQDPDHLGPGPGQDPDQFDPGQEPDHLDSGSGPDSIFILVLARILTSSARSWPWSGS